MQTFVSAVLAECTVAGCIDHTDACLRQPSGRAKPQTKGEPLGSSNAKIRGVRPVAESQQSKDDGIHGMKPSELMLGHQDPVRAHPSYVGKDLGT